MKMCGRCGNSQSVDGFSKDRSRPDGLCPICKRCQSNYYFSRRETALEVGRVWRLANPEKVRAQKREDADKARLRNLEYRKTNSGYFNAKKAERLQRQQGESLSTAVHRKKRWTAGEDLHLLESGGTPLEIALQLGRTVHAVRHRKREIARRALEEL